jgi:UDP-N-acetyl-D-glucosamine dehydrogenase
MITQMQVAIVGQGYVGLTVTVGSLSAGYEVIGIDKSEKTVTSLNKGTSHIEGITNSSIKSGIDSGKYRASTNFSEIQSAQVVIIAVPTPLDLDGKPDISILKSAVNSITPYLTEGALVINESTSYIGTLREDIAEPISAKNPKVEDFAVSPERVDPGNLHFGVKNTPRLVGGINERATNRAAEFYDKFCDHVVKVSSPEVAEAAKLLENTFRYVNIGFVNEFTQIMNSLQIPMSEVISAAATKPYGFMPFFPNVGIGGHCIPVDPLYLQKNAQDVNNSSKYIEISETLNHLMPKYSVERLEKLFGSLKGKKVLVVGISYKPDIADTRESPAQAVMQQLKASGAAVFWHDPLIESFEGQISSKVSGEYDLALVIVKHQGLDMSTWRGGPIYCVNPIDSHRDWIPILGSGGK